MDLYRYCLLLSILGTVCELFACTPMRSESAISGKPVDIKIYQKWEIQRGAQINDYTVVSGLGELAIATQGAAIYAPMTGEARIDQTSCILFFGAEVPGYLFRLCGLKAPQPGQRRQGQPLGNADLLVFATFRKQSDGTWAFVEPSPAIVERTLKPN
ncbi:hypothetical protein [Leptolyngbya sp. AN03gr2]